MSQTYPPRPLRMSPPPLQLSRRPLLRRPLLIPSAIAAGAIITGCGVAAKVVSSGAAPTPVAPVAEPATMAPVAATGLGTFDPVLLQRTSANTFEHLVKLKPAAPKRAAGKKTASSSSSSSSSNSTSGNTAGSSGGSTGSGSGQTVTVVKTITVPGPTVIKTVKPDVPADAGVPSINPPLDVERFTVDGGNIGCFLNGDWARCDVVRRVWDPPAQPGSCGFAWGRGIEVDGARRAAFVCAANSVLDPTSHIIPAGDDDKVGSVTCQVRRVGVTCFDTAGQGFFISRTGYTLF